MIHDYLLVKKRKKKLKKKKLWKILGENWRKVKWTSKIEKGKEKIVFTGGIKDDVLD